MTHTSTNSKRVRIKFKNSFDEFEGVITFFPESSTNAVSRIPAPKFSFKLNDTDGTEMKFEFYTVDTIAYL